MWQSQPRPLECKNSVALWDGSHMEFHSPLEIYSFVLSSCGAAMIGEDSQTESGPPHLSFNLVSHSTVKVKKVGKISTSTDIDTRAIEYSSRS